MNIKYLETRSSPTLLLRFLCAAVLLGTIYALFMRLYLAATLPLWLDETWSGMIASRADWSSLWREAWLDCNPPLYYLFLHGWVALLGDSNLSLRLPSFLFTFVAALMPVLWRPVGLTRFGAWTFAALLLLWQPALLVMIDARGYGLLLVLATASCLVFANLLQRPTLARAAAWVALGTLMFLTHYYSGVLAIGQALVLIFRYRISALRLWPAALIALPGLAWFGYHLPRLTDYARQDVIWYPPTTFYSTLQHLLFTINGQNLFPLAAIILILVLMALQNRRLKLAGLLAERRADRDIALTTLAAGAGFAIAIAIGLSQSSLTDRYFVPLAPPALLGLALAAQRCAAPQFAAMMLAFMFLLPSLNPRFANEHAHERSYYGYETGSDFIANYHPDQLLFFWDHPAGKIINRQSLEKIGSYFMARAGAQVPTRAFVIGEHDNPNPILRAAATGRQPAIIWLYSTNHRSTASEYPPTFENDPKWTCQHKRRSYYGGGQFGTIACVRLKEKAVD